MQHMIGIIDLLLGVGCGIIATIMIVHNVDNLPFFNVLAFGLAICGVALSSVGLYLVSRN